MLCMLCQKKEARVHLTDVKEGKVKKVDLCEDCAKAKNIEDPAGFALADLLLGLGASEELASGATEGSPLVCPHCGFTQADFKKTGRLGCPACYATFKDGLLGMLKTMHKGTRHCGKVPRGLALGREVQERIQSLQRSLEQAVATEDYEQAARLRDQIKALKENPGAVMAG
ncbi:MAG: UvrB/UvrC motif-containing protein [Verrucomicrobia bacterium]|nr:UvrB/UvrC motif-containing protein [Verrucomicrobiota bacterium]